MVLRRLYHFNVKEGRWTKTACSLLNSQSGHPRIRGRGRTRQRRHLVSAREAQQLITRPGGHMFDPHCRTCVRLNVLEEHREHNGSFAYTCMGVVKLVGNYKAGFGSDHD